MKGGISKDTSQTPSGTCRGFPLENDTRWYSFFFKGFPFKAHGSQKESRPILWFPSDRHPPTILSSGLKSTISESSSWVQGEGILDTHQQGLLVERAFTGGAKEGCLKSKNMGSKGSLMCQNHQAAVYPPQGFGDFSPQAEARGQGEDLQNRLADEF